MLIFGEEKLSQSTFFFLLIILYGQPKSWEKSEKSLTISILSYQNGNKKAVLEFYWILF